MNERKNTSESKSVVCKQNKMNTCIQDKQIDFILERFVAK